MSIRQYTTSAALFFDGDSLDAIRIVLFESARRMFLEFDLHPVLFNANGDAFESHDGYALAAGTDDIYLWGGAFPCHGRELAAAIREGALSTLWLDSPRQGARHRDDSRLAFSVSSTDGMLYVGIDEQLVSSPTTLLRRIYGISDSLPPIGYGIGYKMPLADAPASYASGHRPTPLSEVFEMIRHRREWDLRPKSPDKLWTEELMGKKRHLTGLFRDAYPANIVSHSHIRDARLEQCGIGKLSELSDSLWLWELSDDEIPAARQMLEDRGVLVACSRT